MNVMQQTGPFRFLFKAGNDLFDNISFIAILQEFIKHIVKDLFDQLAVLVLQFQLFITVMLIYIPAVPVQGFCQLGDIRQSDELIQFRIPQINDQLHGRVFGCTVIRDLMISSQISFYQRILFIRKLTSTGEQLVCIFSDLLNRFCFSENCELLDFSFFIKNFSFDVWLKDRMTGF